MSQDGKLWFGLKYMDNLEDFFFPGLKRIQSSENDSVLECFQKRREMVEIVHIVKNYLNILYDKTLFERNRFESLHLNRQCIYNFNHVHVNFKDKSCSVIFIIKDGCKDIKTIAIELNKFFEFFKNK